MQNYPGLGCDFRYYLPGLKNTEGVGASSFSKLVIFTYGLAVLGLGSASFYFFDDKDKRAFTLQLLIILQLVDAFFIHLPFIEEKTLDTYSKDMKYFMLTLSISCGIIMNLGYRTN